MSWAGGSSRQPIVILVRMGRRRQSRVSDLFGGLPLTLDIHADVWARWSAAGAVCPPHRCSGGDRCRRRGRSAETDCRTRRASALLARALSPDGPMRRKIPLIEPCARRHGNRARDTLGVPEIWSGSKMNTSSGTSASVAGMRSGAFVSRVGWIPSHGLYRMGDPGNPDVLVCVHGLTRNGRDFDDLARAMSDRLQGGLPGRCRAWPQRLVARQDGLRLSYVSGRYGRADRAPDVETVHWSGLRWGLIGMLPGQSARAGPRLPHGPQ